MGPAKQENGGCFLIGSGPSLKEVDVARLKRLDSIAFNRSFVAWKSWGFSPTHYACLDPVVFEDNAQEIRGLIEKCPRTHFFLPENSRFAGIAPSARVSLVRLVPGRRFSSNVCELTDFGNVGATSIQILALLGYQRIAMIGVDARYSPIHESVAVADKEGFVYVADDVDHFCPEYVQGKRLIARPDLQKILGQWPQVAEECAARAIDVRNASPGSALDCFPKIDFPLAIEWVLGNREFCDFGPN